VPDCAIITLSVAGGLALSVATFALAAWAGRWPPYRGMAWLRRWDRRL
jgi:hypothetical protein